RLKLFVTNSSLRLLNLRSDPFGVVCRVGALGAKLVGRDDCDQLSLLNAVAFADEQLVDAAADLRSDDNVVGGDNAGQLQLRNGTIEVPVRAAGGGKHDEKREKFFHERRERSNVCIKRLFDDCQPIG